MRASKSVGLGDWWGVSGWFGGGLVDGWEGDGGDIVPYEETPTRLLCGDEEMSEDPGALSSWTMAKTRADGVDVLLRTSAPNRRVGELVIAEQHQPWLCVVVVADPRGDPGTRGADIMPSSP